MTYEITVNDADRRVDYVLSVEPYCDDLGRYVEPNEVVLESFVLWIGKQGHEGTPLTNSDAKHAGRELARKFEAEIDEAVRREIAKEAVPV